VLATDVNVSVGLGITQIDSSIHGGDQRIVKQGVGTLVLSAANIHTGGIVVSEGTLVVRNVAALGIGPVEVQAGAKLVLDDGSGTVEATSLVLQEGGLIDVGSSSRFKPVSRRRCSSPQFSPPRVTALGTGHRASDRASCGRCSKTERPAPWDGSRGSPMTIPRIP
jgi:autotransporter-associated beta strand protein